MTEDSRFLGREMLLAAAVTFAAWIAASIVIGVSTIFDSLAVLEVTIVVFSIIPAAVGAWFGAKRVVSDLGHGLAAAAVGLSGALLVIIVLAVVGNIGNERAALMPTVVWPVVGALTGAWFGGIRR